MANYTAKKLKEIRSIFRLHDNYGDNKIAVTQVGNCLRVLGTNPSEAVVRKYIEQLGPTGRITFDKFLDIYEDILRMPCTHAAEDLIASLRLFDDAGNGKMSAAHLRRLLTTCGGEQLSFKELDELLSQRVDAKGQINYVEFVHMIMNG
ncbi:myosin-2 essential light chain [Scaptodrosophila lebanonensis]|uniref:Myosin-2 essential light chain n=1 Tax=Drosophila lebanonensis TaxID=7225 RepID=A0A6J2U7P5_DROLE|nr:myosin-2 essential light chain [Scaptodrosophila lebanonensis]